MWEHSKGTQRLPNGWKDYPNISIPLFGENIVFFWSKRHKKQIAALKYLVESHNFTWSDFLNRHLALYNQRAAIDYCAYELGHVVIQWTEYKK